MKINEVNSEDTEAGKGIEDCDPWNSTFILTSIEEQLHQISHFALVLVNCR